MELPEPCNAGVVFFKTSSFDAGNSFPTVTSLNLQKKRVGALKNLRATNHLYEVNDVQKYLIQQ